MKAGSCWRWRVRGAASLLAVLAVLLFAPAAVHAGCGDYVILAPASATIPQHFDGRVHETGPGTPPKPTAPAPCNGPNCSRAPLEAPLTPTTLSPGPNEQWASALDSGAADAPRSGSWVAEPVCS